VFQSFYNLKCPLSKKQKGRFGEEFSSYVLQNNFKFTLVEKNMRTPYGEIDLVMQDSNGFVFVEVKTDFVGKEGCELWSHAQRVRFRSSQAWFSKKKKSVVHGYFVFINSKKIALSLV